MRLVSQSVARLRTIKVDLLAVGAGLATPIALFALVLTPLLTPTVLHYLLRYAGSAERVGVSPALASALSDATASELVWGPATFELVDLSGQPLYGPAEVAHLQDVHRLLQTILGLGVIAALFLGVTLWLTHGQASVLQAMRRAALSTVISTMILGFVGVLGFEQAFHMFHEIFFATGSYSFNGASAVLVRLYPTDFWEAFAAVLATLIILVGLVARWLLLPEIKAESIASSTS